MLHPKLPCAADLAKTAFEGLFIQFSFGRSSAVLPTSYSRDVMARGVVGVSFDTRLTEIRLQLLPPLMMHTSLILSTDKWGTHCLPQTYFATGTC